MSRNQRPELLAVGDLKLDPATGTLWGPAGEVKLNPMQVRLLARLLRQPGELVSRATIMRDVWKTTWLGDTRTLTVHVSWLRRAIEPEPSQPRYLVTRRGRGYAIHPDGAGQAMSASHRRP